MGLDMYLSAKIHVHGYKWENSQADNEIYDKVINAVGAEAFRSETNPHADVTITVGYWRKANAIHGWFVNNVQNGEDNCRSYYVSKEQLEELQRACIEVLADRTKASELLPPTEGFFFGSDEYDEYYYEELRRTVTLIGKILKTIPEKDWSIEYQSSW